ncbi:RHS repeat domain-containing protein [Catenulispora rubra]|uniref:RHS repeat domain-containing protein n=1 Tax=Catenulispora rubra TaxID=280293 RepID=UPI0018927225|nr:RHS repeat-associated core domain-containing protein [Catenulispora rubra]
MIGMSPPPSGRGRHARWRHRLTTVAAAGAMLAGFGLNPAQATPAAAGRHWQPVATQKTPSVPGHAGVPAGQSALAANHGVPPVPYKATAPVWPSGQASATLVSLAKAATTAAARPAPGSGRHATTPIAQTSPDAAHPANPANPNAATKLTGLPVTLASADGSAAGAATAATVAFAPRAAVTAAGVDGVVLTVSRTDGGRTPSPVDLTLDYKGFATASGGGYADRLTLVELPACALTTPTVPSCRAQTPIAARNDTASGTLSARVAVSATPMVLAAAPQASGGVGDYSATSLSAEGSWAGGGNTGSFTYSYPIALPPASGGKAPDVTLAYDSGSVDGRTSVTNAQASWIGDGWDYSPGYIERSYQPCSQDGIKNSGDTCWGGNQVTLSMKGLSGTLVRDDTTGAWHSQSDSGEKIIPLTGVSNGAWQGEAWEIVTTDGTRYYFGQDYLPGGDGTDAATDSVWTQPVYCPKSGDGPPEGGCYDSGKGTGSVVTNMAWRWNLDYVVDPHGNLRTYSWTPETDEYEMGYGQNNNSGKLTPYDRGGYLTSIGYGYSLSAAIAGAKPAQTVTFGVDERCLTSSSFTNCANSNLNSSTAPNWPDVPFNQICAAGAASCANYSPTYFSTKRLTSISTAVLVGSTYQPVDTFTLSQSFPAPQAGLVPAGSSVSASNPGDGSVAVMWLDSIQRKGQDTLGGGTAAQLPKTVFTADEMPNRVDGNTTGAAALYRPRLVEITTDAGAQTVVAYSASQCSRTSGKLPASADSDSMNCYPQYWTPNGAANPVLDWFTTYQVTSVTVNDLVAPNAWSEASLTSYKYDGAAWHRDDSPLTPSAQRTWDQFRGFRTVTTTTGASSVQSTPTRSVTTYLQGMDGDYLSSGAQRTVSVSDSVGDSVTDSSWLYGQQLEKDTLLGVGGVTQNKEVSGPWAFAQTASQPQASSMPALVARMATGSTDRKYQLWHDGTWEQTKLATSYNAQGQQVSADTSYSGPSASPEQCTTTKYATNAGAYMYSYPEESLTVTGGCSTKPSASATQSDTLTFYDGSSTLGSLGSTGNATTTEKAASYNTSGAPVYVTTAKSQYDTYGRVTSATDADGDSTATAYSAPGAASDTVTVTNPMGWVTKQTLDAGRGQAVASTDVDNELTTKTYDGLGRLTAVWSPLHSQAAKAPADAEYTYAITATAPTAVTTSTLRDDGSYGTVITLYDGQLRQIQQQGNTADGEVGRLITDTHYNSLGQKAKVTGSYYDKTTAPAATVFVPANDSVVPSETETMYDGAGRQIQVLTVAFGVNQYSALTGYQGMDETDSTPPAGGTATSSFVDAAGNVDATWSYRSATPTGKAADAETISRVFTPAGKPATIKDSVGDTWSYTYNLLGQNTVVADPGTGTSTSVYSTGGSLLSQTDANGDQLSYTYDALKRKTAEYDTSGGAAPTGADQIGAWTYDTLAKGQPTSSTTYTDGAGDAANTWTETVAGYTAKYQPTGEAVTVPSSQGALAGTYQDSSQYTAQTSLLAGTHYYAEGNLPKEQVNFGYTASGLLSSYGSPYTALNTVTYNPLGQVLQTNYGANGDQLDRTVTYDPATKRMLTTTDSLQNLGKPMQSVAYTYNKAGAITAESNAVTGSSTPDTQCFGYDQLNELTSAWTDSGGVTASSPATNAQIDGVGACTDSAPTAGKVTGGPAPYWQSYSYDALGDRVGQTSHDTSATSTTNTVTQTLAYNAYNASTGTTTAASTPDAVQSVTTAGTSGSTTAAYTYYPNGQTRTRPGQAFTYNAMGLTRSVTNTATGVAGTYTYDADGTLLVQSDPAAAQNVLYLPWGEQITLNTSGNTVSGLRYVSNSPDGVTVVHSSSGTVGYELTNTNGTATAEVNASNLTYSVRYYDPFGRQRGTAPPSWPDQRAYLDLPSDPTSGLDLLGARQYDPVTGRFLSVDSVQENTDQRQLNGYSYAGDNPVNGSDPTGTMLACEDGPGSVCYYPHPGTGSSSSSSSSSPPSSSSDSGGEAPQDPFFPIYEKVRSYVEQNLAPLDAIAFDKILELAQNKASQTQVLNSIDRMLEITDALKMGKLADGIDTILQATHFDSLVAITREGTPFLAASRTTAVLGLVADYGDVILPPDKGAVGWVDRGAGAVNGGLLMANMVVDELPVAGEVMMIGTGVYLGGDYLYHHWKPFHDVVNDVGHGVSSFFGGLFGGGSSNDSDAPVKPQWPNGCGG